MACAHDFVEELENTLTSTFAGLMSQNRAFFYMTSRAPRKSLGLGMSQFLKLGHPRSTSFQVTDQVTRHSSTVPTLSPSSVNHTSNKIAKTVSTVTEVVGNSGCRYLIQEILQEKGSPMRRVYLARYEILNLICHYASFLKVGPSDGKESFVLKDVPQSDFEYLLDLYRGLRSSPYLRLLHDTVPEESMLVYKYFTSNLLNLVQKDLPIAQTKRNLKHTLHGLAALHEQNIVHTGKRDLSCADGSYAVTDMPQM